MKNLYLLFSFFLLLTGKPLIAQNLVPNPSFEIYDTCVDFAGQINRAIGWYSAGSDPEYFNACATGVNWCSVPLNYFGYRTPASGNAYAGIIARWEHTDGMREYIGAQLLPPLQTGIKYFASFKVSLAAHANNINWCGINKLGILFSTAHYSIASCTNCAQICSDSIVTDTLHWTRLTGSFVADSNYAFISIGRFNINALTDSIMIEGSGCNAYYYIDDVAISQDSVYVYNYSYTDTINLVGNDEITIYPNPISDFLTIDDKMEIITGFRIYNIIGDLVKSYVIINSKSHTLNLSYLSQGIYLLVTYTKNNTQINHKLIKL